MKFTLIKKNETNGLRVTTRNIRLVMQRMKSRKPGCHEVYPGVEMRKCADGSLTAIRQNGIIVLTISEVDPDDLAKVKQAAMILPTTIAAFAGADRRSVKLLVGYMSENGELPPDEATADTLAAAAYEQAVVAYGRVTGKSIIREQPSTRMHFTMPHDEQPIMNPEAIPLSLGKFGTMTLLLINFLNSRWHFRFNTIMGYTEYKLKHTDASWQPVDDRTTNSLTMAARLSGLDAWDKDIKRYVQSGMIQSFNPIEDFLGNARQKWDGKTDHIGQLARTVPCDVPQWEGWFRKWLLYMVAQWLGRTHQYGNSVAPLLISEQGNNKSTFCRRLLPDSLQWGYNDNLIISEKKQTLQAMSQFLLINLDEFNQISPSIQEGFLKNVIQLARVKSKRPYGRHVEDFPRLASFIATTNEPSVLTDASGNRRFIGIRLTGAIDLSQPIDYEGLYGQAVRCIEQGERYWFNDQEVREIMAHNRQFQVKPPTEQWFNECFAIATDESEGQWLTSAAIFGSIRREIGSSFHGNLVAFGRILSHMEGLHQKHSNIGKVYLVRRKH